MSSDEDNEDVTAGLLGHPETLLDNGASDSESGEDATTDRASAGSAGRARTSGKANAHGKYPFGGFPDLEASDEDSDNDSQAIEKMKQKAARSRAKSKGKFASFGLSPAVLKNIKKKGYRQPTPIQRKTIPLIMENRDVVGMARTGSGKTAAFLLPLVEKLRAHASRIGVRAVILSPTRELALQTYRQLKEFTNGTDIRSLLIVGGDSLEDQFAAMVRNPDVVVATPGRFLHVKVEMRLDLRTVEYIVYDEADRLFEMGFRDQLTEILDSLAEKRQSLLFSATLPRTLVEFARAGLRNPVLVRLDAESKISDNLQMCFLSCKASERDANLLYILEDIIKMPPATAEQRKRFEEVTGWKMADDDAEAAGGQNRRREKRTRVKPARANELPSEKATIVFVPTRHHVDYVTGMLRDSGYCVSYVYGSLDQHARRRQLSAFRGGITSVMVVTDVAARGIDIPILANVVNYTFPATAKLFVHRVGRTARAGNSGWAYSIVGETELPYLMDLEVFLGRKVLLTPMQEKKTEILRGVWREKHGGSDDGFQEPPVSFTTRLVLGGAPRAEIETKQETATMLLRTDYDLAVQRDVCGRAARMLKKTRPAASADGVRRAKETMLVGWDDQNLLFGKNAEREKEKLLAKFKNRRHKETVFEIKGADDYLVGLMAKRRREIAPIERRATKRRRLAEEERLMGLTHRLADETAAADEKGGGKTAAGGEVAGEDEISSVFEDADQLERRKRKKHKKLSRDSFRDPQFYLPQYAPRDAAADRQMAVEGFGAAAAEASFGVGEDQTTQGEVQKQRPKVVWDHKKKRYVKNQDNRKYIIGENGQRIPASLRSGKFDEWKEQHRVEGFRAGMREQGVHGSGIDSKELRGGREGGRFMHNRQQAPRMPDRTARHYSKKMEKVKRAVNNGLKVKGWQGKGAQSELRSTEEIRKRRELKEKRRAKNGRRRH